MERKMCEKGKVEGLGRKKKRNDRHSISENFDFSVFEKEEMTTERGGREEIIQKRNFKKSKNTTQVHFLELQKFDSIRS